MHPRYPDTTGHDPLEHAARKRASMKLGWYIHATVYLLVNAGLMALSMSQGRHWAFYPALFWGLGLLAHGAAVWLSAPRGALWQHLVQREREALARAQPGNPPAPY